MKLAVITLYDYYNYGSYLQAWAMQKYLKSLENEVYYVRTQSLRRRIRRGFLSENNILFDIQKILYFQKDLAHFKQIKIDDLQKKGIEGVIIGSDELWNADNDAFNQYPYYYGIGYELPTIVYAMSLGNGNYDTLLKKDYISPGIQKLENIYARDYSAAEAIGKICKREINLVCDPTLLLDKEDYINLEKNFDLDSYILVYSYDMPQFLQKYIRTYANERKLKIISACFAMDCADKVINCNPLRFPMLVKGAEVVITSTFHGSIFSIMFNKSMTVLPYAKKTTDLLKQLHLDDIIIKSDCSYDKFKEKVQQDIDFSYANRKIATMKEKSRNIIEEFVKSV